MNFNKNFKVIIALIFLLIPAITNAQWYNRIEVGYSYITATAQFNGKSGFYNQDGTFGGDTSIKRNITASAGLGYDFGFAIPLKRVGRINMWALSIHFLYNEYIWEGLNEAYNANGSYSSVTGFPDLYGATAQIGLPISVDYKIGTDAICSKRVRFGCTFGAGVMPSYNLTALVGVDGAGAGAGSGVNPFVKAEVAVFGGICFKLRALYSFGDVAYIDQSKNDLAFTSGPFTVTGKSELMLSFLVMPFAWHWKEQEWYNTFGRYNPYQ